MAIQRPPKNGEKDPESLSDKESQRSALDRYLEKQKATREPKPPRNTASVVPPEPTRRSLLRTQNGDPKPKDDQPDLSRWERVADSAQVSEPSPVEAEVLQEKERKALEYGAPVVPPVVPPPLVMRQSSAMGSPGDVGQRFFAYLIDILIIFAIRFPLMKMMTAVLVLLGLSYDALDGFHYLLTYGVLLSYYGWFYPRKGASPGKMLFGLEIVDSESGERINMWKAFFREAVGKMISFVPFSIGFIVAMTRADHRALHDLLFDTRVVRRDETSKSRQSENRA